MTRRGVRTLEFELHRLVNAEWASDKKRRGGYSDADRSRVSRLFEYTYTWRNITKIAFVGKWIEFQFGQNKEYTTPPWFYFSFSDDFEKDARPNLPCFFG